MDDDAPECPVCHTELRPRPGGGGRWLQACKCDDLEIADAHEQHPSSDLRARLGANVRTARRRLGLTQGQLADRLGEHQPSIAQLEAGRYWPGPERWAAIAKLLELEPSELIE